ncbi:MAG: hypothetical protein ABI476_04315 [Oxalobacteraceae bacterium]
MVSPELEMHKRGLLRYLARRRTMFRIIGGNKVNLSGKSGI